MATDRRSYTREFKLAAVQSIAEQKLSVAEAARRLGLAPKLLRRWRDELAEATGDAFPNHGRLPPIDDELRRLRAENARLRAERDILKKVTALFARESP